MTNEVTDNEVTDNEVTDDEVKDNEECYDDLATRETYARMNEIMAARVWPVIEDVVGMRQHHKDETLFGVAAGAASFLTASTASVAIDMIQRSVQAMPREQLLAFQPQDALDMWDEVMKVVHNEMETKRELVIIEVARYVDARLTEEEKVNEEG